MPTWKRASTPPIIAFEYLNRFYVQEGNKRVSVLKYYGAVKIPGTVTRLVPARTDELQNRIYYEFLDFYKLSKVNALQFSRPAAMQSSRPWYAKRLRRAGPRTTGAILQRFMQSSASSFMCWGAGAWT